MKTYIKIPRILKIKNIEGFTISCIFNNGELRDIDFKKLFLKWKLSKGDIEYPLKKLENFKHVVVRNNTLCWPNIKVITLNSKGEEEQHPLDLDPVVLYESSTPNKHAFKKFNIGAMIKKERTSKGLSQDELALRSGTSKTYISRVENNKIEPELHTLYKIVELGLGKKVELKII